MHNSIEKKCPRISVIMGIYNCAQTLAEALDSLLAQTYQQFKVIMCDDGSSDNTIEIAQGYVERYPQQFILIRNEKNRKLAATLNHCLEYVDTEYVARMDGDDISLPERFEKEIKFLDTHIEYALVSCPMIYFDEEGDYKKGHAKETPQKEDFKYGTPFCHAPVMMRTDILNKIGNYTSEPWTERIEDYYLWYKFYKAGYKGFNLSEPLYKMRNGRDAISRRKPADRWRTYKLGIRVNKSLGLSYPYLSGLRGLSKILVPNKVLVCISKFRNRRARSAFKSSASQ